MVKKMVKQTWMEHLMITIEKARNQNGWTNHEEKKFRCILELYHTGKFNNFSKRKIMQLLSNCR